MGKYNFSAAKFDEILARLDTLEQRNVELAAENARLKAIRNIMPVRIVIDDIGNSESAKQLFSVASHDNEIIKDQKSFKANFQIFYQNIFRALNPYPRIYKNRETITYTPINTLSEEEYQIHIQTLEAIIDTIFYAKQKLNNIRGDKNDSK